MCGRRRHGLGLEDSLGPSRDRAIRSAAMWIERTTCLGVQVRVTMSTSCVGQTTNECPSGQSGAHWTPMRPRTSASHSSTSGSQSFPRRKFRSAQIPSVPTGRAQLLSSSSVRSRSRLRCRGIVGSSVVDLAATPRTVRTKLSTWAVAACSTPAAGAPWLYHSQGSRKLYSGEGRSWTFPWEPKRKVDEHLGRSVTPRAAQPEGRLGSRSRRSW